MPPLLRGCMITYSGRAGRVVGGWRAECPIDGENPSVPFCVFDSEGTGWISFAGAAAEYLALQPIPCDPMSSGDLDW